MNNPIAEINQNGYFHVFFCESVRTEINDRHTFVGIYPNNLKVKSFPHILPQLSLAATLVIPISEASNKNISLKVLMDDKVIGCVDLNSVKNDTTVGKNNNVLEVSNLAINGGPLEIKKPCTIKARIDIADTSILALSELRIVQE